MIKTRALLAASAALTILFSPSIFAESYRICKYWHEEYRIENGVKTYSYDEDGDGVNDGIPPHIYKELRIEVYEECPDEPPAMPGHTWEPSENAGDDDFYYVGQRTTDILTCETRRTVSTFRDNWDIQ